MLEKLSLKPCCINKLSFWGFLVLSFSLFLFSKKSQCLWYVFYIFYIKISGFVSRSLISQATGPWFQGVQLKQVCFLTEQNRGRMSRASGVEWALLDFSLFLLNSFLTWECVGDTKETYSPDLNLGNSTQKNGRIPLHPVPEHKKKSQYNLLTLIT